MDVNAMLTEDAPERRHSSPPSPPTCESTPVTAMTPTSLSPNSEAKMVNFKLRDSPADARSFYIRPHDTVDSIIEAAKHLFGIHWELYLGVSFEAEDGVRFVPNYHNFTDGMTVYVCVEQQTVVRKRSYSLRHPAMIDGAYDSRSVSPPSRGRRSTSSSNDRARSLKRQAETHDVRDICYDEDPRYEEWYLQPRQQRLPDDDEEDRQSASALASADISLDNIVEGSRRKKPKFSADELPLFPPPTLPPLHGSPVSVSPSHPPAQVSTPYRNYSFAHPTPPSYGGNNASCYVSANSQARGSGAVPTPAPTIASCISDEDVAMQLMRLGNANNNSKAVSVMDEIHDHDHGFASETGEYGDDGRSDTTELPDPLPTTNGHGGLPDSPILYPRPLKNFKSLDEILPSFDTTEPSDDENQPPEHNYYTHYSHSGHHSRRPHGLVTDDEDEGCDDEADGSYVGKEESEDDNDYDEDLDDVPLKMRRDRKFSVPLGTDFGCKSQQLGKSIKLVKRPTILKSKPLPLKTDQTPHHYPISPASPPASRKPSIASSNGKPRSNGVMANGYSAAMFQDMSHLNEALDDPNLKPRCQRCRKSKKGCDRQRPCQRCKDAGIPAEGCISEDEAGTRRGRQAAAAAKRAGIVNGLAKLKNKPKKKKVA